MISSDIGALLLPNLRSILGKYNQKPLQYTQIFDTEESHKSKETSAMMQYTGYASIMNEGSQVTNGTMSQRYTSDVYHKQVSIGFEITKQALADDLYKDHFPKQASSLRDSLQATKEVLAAQVLNQGFNAAYPLGDGQPIFSNAHPTAVGIFSNNLAGTAGADLSLIALQQMVILAQKMPFESGIVANIGVDRIVVSRELQFVIEQLLGSKYDPETANNGINTVNGLFKRGYVVNHQLTNANSFFGLTDAPRSRVHYNRQSVEATTYADPKTYNLLVTANERYSFAFLDPRGAIGSPGS